MHALKTFAATALALAGMTGQALSAPPCTTADDMAAFRTAAVQQQLMVAALTCKDIDAYNRFVLAYRPELQKSDNDLKAYFIRGGSEAAYDTFKTKLANLSALSDSANGPAYCANAAAAFDMALQSRQSLASFVADQRLMIALPGQSMCEAKTMTAAADKPVTPKAAPVRLAAAAPVAVAPVAIEGVPSYAMPASPYGAARDDRDTDAPPPPPPPPQAQGNAYAASYAAPPYGYPPNWWPRAYYRPWDRMPEGYNNGR